MNVCMIAQQSISVVSGGPLIQARETARYLPDHGVSVRMFNPWEEFRRDEIDLVHVFGANMMTYDVTLRLHQLGVPFVISSIFFTSHGPRFIRIARGFERLAKRFFSGVWIDYGLSASLCQQASLVLPNSSKEGEMVAEGFDVPSSKIRVIPNGVDARFQHADPSLFIGKYGVKDFVMNVGHIGSPRKNVLSLLQAMREVDRPLVIIGRIYRNEYGERCLAEARRNSNVTIIDGLPNDSEMLASAYAACEIFALPSHFETPGIAALEAALAGAKIVITPHGGTADYFADKAVYVEPSSTRSIREGIERALGMPRDPSLRRRMIDEYLWPSVSAKTAVAYREALGA